MMPYLRSTNVGRSSQFRVIFAEWKVTARKVTHAIIDRYFYFEEIQQSVRESS